MQSRVGQPRWVTHPRYRMWSGLGKLTFTEGVVWPSLDCVACSYFNLDREDFAKSTSRFSVRTHLRKLKKSDQHFTLMVSCQGHWEDLKEILSAQRVLPSKFQERQTHSCLFHSLSQKNIPCANHTKTKTDSPFLSSVDIQSSEVVVMGSFPFCHFPELLENILRSLETWFGLFNGGTLQFEVLLGHQGRVRGMLSFWPIRWVCGRSQICGNLLMHFLFPQQSSKN